MRKIATPANRAARFSRWLNMSSTLACFAALNRSNAMKRPEEARLLFDDAQPLTVQSEHQPS